MTTTLPRRPLVLAEISKTGYEHNSFNAAVIADIEEKQPPRLLYWIAHKSHLPQLTSARNRIRINIPVSVATSRWQALLKYPIEALVALWTLWFARRKKAHVCFLSLSPTTLLLLAGVAKLGAQFTVLVHNELETLMQPFKRGILHRQGVMHAALQGFRHSSATLVCLSQHGTDMIRDRYAGVDVRHADLPMSRFDVAFEPGGKKFDFAIVGTLKDPAINGNVRRLCEMLSTRSKASGRRYDLKLIGGRGLEPSTMSALRCNEAFHLSHVQPIEKDDYLRELSTCSRALFLCTPQMYSVSASSVLVDCISVPVAVLSMACNYARELQQFADIQICDTLEDLSNAMANAMDHGDAARTATSRAVSSSLASVICPD